MFNSLKNRNIKYSLTKVTDILNTYTIPKFQRKVFNDRINILDNEFHFDFNPIMPIIFVNFKNVRYLIDGNHRMNVYIKNNRFTTEKILVADITANNESDIFKYFKIINNNMTLNDVYISGDTNYSSNSDFENYQKNIVINTYNHFLDTYPNTFKYKGKRRPFLDNNTFLDQINNIFNNNKDKFKSSNELINKLEDLNNEYSKKSIDWFPSKNKTRNGNLIDIIFKNKCLYFGMIPDNWVSHLDNIPEIMSEDNISQTLRQNVWMKYSDANLSIKCLCCDINEINCFTFECGHVLAKSNGGKCNTENLVPLCSLCNKSMGKIHMFTYMETNNYHDNIKNIQSKMNI